MESQRVETEIKSTGKAPSLTIERSLVSDPTALTTQMVWREIASVERLLSERILSIERSIDIAHQDLVRVPTEVQKQIGYLKELTDEKLQSATKVHAAYEALVKEKFESIATQFLERDSRMQESARSSKLAVDAALQASKEAVSEQNRSTSLAASKSESAFSEQIKAQAQLINTTFNSLDGKLGDLKERITRLESLDAGAAGAVSARHVSVNYAFVIAGFFVALLGTVGGILIAFWKS